MLNKDPVALLFINNLNLNTSPARLNTLMPFVPNVKMFSKTRLNSVLP